MTAPARLALDGGLPCLAASSAASCPLTAGEPLGVEALLPPQRGGSSERHPPLVARLERRWSDATDRVYVIACRSGSVAAQLGLACLELGPGDEVICPAGTHFASLGAIHGAVVLHVDIDPVNLHIDPDAVEAAITHRTGAILALDLYGTPADFGALEAVADRHGLPVLEDASQACGARLNRRPVGSLGTVSFSSLPGPGSMWDAGDGGVLSTDDVDLAANARRALLVDDQLDLGPGAPGSPLGWTYRLSELDASTAEAGLDRLDEETAARMANGNHLRCQLRDLAGIELPEAVPGATNVYSSFPVLVQPDELGLPEAAAAALRDTLQACMLAEGLPLDRWQPEPIGGPVVPGRPPAQRQLPPPVGIADHPVADAVRASTLLLGRDRSLLGTPSTARTMEKIAECFNKVLVENRDRLRQLACERMSTPAAV